MDRWFPDSLFLNSFILPTHTHTHTQVAWLHFRKMYSAPLRVVLAEVLDFRLSFRLACLDFGLDVGLAGLVLVLMGLWLDWTWLWTWSWPGDPCWTCLWFGMIDFVPSLEVFKLNYEIKTRNVVNQNYPVILLCFITTLENYPVLFISNKPQAWTEDFSQEKANQMLSF